ncbi:MAG TPA: SNF2-related protein [Candidatus Binatia bacterium]
MGYITDAIADQVAPLTKQRGRTYFASGAVRLIEGDDEHVVATVQGSRRYDVEISAGEVMVDTSCTCPFFARDYEPCKHIWAAALAAEQKGYVGMARELVNDDFDGIIEPRFEPRNQPRRAERRPATADWKYDLHKLRADIESHQRRSEITGVPERQLVYLIDIDTSLDTQKLIIEIAHHDRKKDGAWGKLKTAKLYGRHIDSLEDAADRRILSILFGVRQEITYGYSAYDYESSAAYFTLPPTLWDLLLPLMCSTGRCFVQRQDTVEESKPVQWDDGAPWEFVIEMIAAPDGQRHNVNGFFKRGETRIDVTAPDLILPGLMVYDKTVARVNDHGAFHWIGLLLERGSLTIPHRETEHFVEQFINFPQRPEILLPDELKFETLTAPPKPRLVVKTAEPRAWDTRPRLTGELLFDYEGVMIEHGRPGDAIYEKERRRVLKRDLNAEAEAVKRVTQLGVRKDRWRNTAKFDLYSEILPRLVRTLTQEGWRIEAEGKLYRAGANLRIEVTSGVDWFEVGGSAQFGDMTVSAPKLLRALKQGEETVRLDDGTFGIVPEEWMRKYRLLADLGTMEQNHFRFKRPQAGLLDALLAAESVQTDATFDRVRREIQEFSGVEAVDPAPSFAGELRHYQREGLGWLLFLQRFGFGGCLADDMGLGKTVQVLALLESRRLLRAKTSHHPPPPSLVVVPRSLVFHWKAESARFTPKLRILDHTGALRLKPGDHFEDYDVVLTTYGTLRRDALHLKDHAFDYCVLDEAQAIKNAGTLSAKAARLLKAKHRLAMSGTPVENHLGELWSLFEFLNPGMLGSASVFGAARQDSSPTTRTVLARALKPFILRRTKAEVARELPPKIEQTIFCDLNPPDRKLYNELRNYYRARLLKDNGDGPVGRVKFQALEALLRLRQAACHVGLIDKGKTGETSAKLETLFAQLEQVLDEGHKTLVFSQFTSLLALVRGRLDRDEIPYVYLDGKTRDREARVEQFQNDENTKIFLISLKAGGLGLNLHAAEYVYLLDPWWNPAVEAQAIDRVHRIGQTRQVFAYRLIARDTVEEKVLALQQTKRELADAIITADDSLLQSLTREDLELLLS